MCARMLFGRLRMVLAGSLKRMSNKNHVMVTDAYLRDAANTITSPRGISLLLFVLDQLMEVLMLGW